jgi:hypothetical protein
VVADLSPGLDNQAPSPTGGLEKIRAMQILLDLSGALILSEIRLICVRLLCNFRSG